MKKMMSAILALSILSPLAHAEETIDSFRGTTIATSIVTLCATGGFGHVCRVVAAAQDDLAYFVGTEGQVRTAQLETALQVVRKYRNDQISSDLELAASLIGETH